MSSTTASSLVMFSKAPVPGRVKTRLAAAVGGDVAARLQAAFLRDLGNRFAAFAGETVLACAPSVDHPLFRELAALGWRLVPQGPGDLGERLARVVGQCVAAGSARVIVIGSDSPSLPVALVDRALAALDDVEAVIGPVVDGGYYLVGTRSAHAALFEDIPWGTDRVFATTVRRLDGARISYQVIPFWYDVDDLNALRCLASHLGLPGPYGPFEGPACEAMLRTLDMEALLG